LSARERLLQEYGDSVVILSTANSYSHEKRHLSFGRYVREIVDHEWTGDEVGDRSFYHFGDHNHSEWALLFDAYVQPTHLLDYETEGSMSFGVGASGSGVPMHVHGPVFAEVWKWVVWLDARERERESEEEVFCGSNQSY
jgi:jumonji domain-containing protein 8